MSHLSKIFAPWDDNAEAMAADIGESGVLVRQWRNRGKIHSDHWPKIIKAAAGRGTVLRPEDFWPPEIVADLPPVAFTPEQVSDQPAGDDTANAAARAFEVPFHDLDDNAVPAGRSPGKFGGSTAQAVRA